MQNNSVEEENATALQMKIRVECIYPVITYCTNCRGLWKMHLLQYWGMEGGVGEGGGVHGELNFLHYCIPTSVAEPFY